MGDFVRLEQVGNVRHLVLDAPERRNALDMPMLAEISAAIDDVIDDADARALVVSGEGKAFCAGANLDSLFGDTSRPAFALRDDLKKVYGSFLKLGDLKIPTISAVNGAAVGAGVNIALACDVVIAGPRAKFGITFADIGLHPGGGCSWFLVQKLGKARALDVILNAEIIDGETAMEIGLATKLADDPVAVALESAERWAQRDPGLVRDMKRAVQLAAQSDLASVLEFESWAQASSVGKPRFQEFMREFTKKH